MENDTNQAELREAFFLGDKAAITASLETLSSPDIRRALLLLSPEERASLLTLMDAEIAARLIALLPDETAAAAIHDIEAETATHIVEEMDSDDRADVLAQMPEAETEAILNAMDDEEAAETRTLMDYPADQAGGLMMTEMFKFRQDETIVSILRQLSSEDEAYERYRRQHPYVTDATGKLVGVVSVRGMLGARRNTALADVMASPISVSPETPLATLRDLFDEHPFLSLPVINENEHLIGVVPRDSVAEAELHRVESEVQKLQGVINEELRSMPTLFRARRRLSWLSINIVLNIIAASVIAFYEDTLTAVIALAVFLPIVSDMSGCSGNQAVAVSMRELTLGIARPSEMLRVWIKEASVGLINGAILGALIAAVAWAWKGNPYIGLVVGLALAINTVIAVSIGGTVPLLLKRFDVDPAVASGPMLTTITDMCGFFLVLSLATAMMPLLIAT